MSGEAYRSASLCNELSVFIPSLTSCRLVTTFIVLIRVSKAWINRSLKALGLFASELLAAGLSAPDDDDPTGAAEAPDPKDTPLVLALVLKLLPIDDDTTDTDLLEEPPPPAGVPGLVFCIISACFIPKAKAVAAAIGANVGPYTGMAAVD